jgi:hypothetical protein
VPQGRYGQVRKISHSPEFDPRTVQPVCRLSYPGPHTDGTADDNIHFVSLDMMAAYITVPFLGAVNVKRGETKCSILPAHAMKASKGSRGTAPGHLGKRKICCS